MPVYTVHEPPRKETDRDLKRRIVAKLALMPSPAARDYMLELLK